MFAHVWEQQAQSMNVHARFCRWSQAISHGTGIPGLWPTSGCDINRAWEQLNIKLLAWSRSSISQLLCDSSVNIISATHTHTHSHTVSHTHTQKLSEPRCAGLKRLDLQGASLMDASMLLVLVGSPKIQSRARTRHQRLLCQMHPAAITQRSSDLSAETPLLRMV